MKTKQLYLWTTCYEKSHSLGSHLHLLRIIIFPGLAYAPSHRPLTCYEKDFDADSIELKFQANVGEVQQGTIDGPRWYGPDFTLARRRIGGKSELFSWFTRIFPEKVSHFCDVDVAAIIDGLTRAKALRVAHSSELSSYVACADYDKAQDYRMYVDRGIVTNGCTVNAYVRKGWGDEEITSEVTRRMRECRSLSTEDLARWVANGSQWEPGYRCADTSDHNTPLSVIIGTPAPQQAAA